MLGEKIAVRLSLRVAVLDQSKSKLRLDFKRQVEAAGRIVSVDPPSILIGHADCRGERYYEWILKDCIDPMSKPPCIGDVVLNADREAEFLFYSEPEINAWRLFWEFLVKVRGFKQV